MNKFKLHYKIIAVIITLFMTFQSLNEINSHTYTTGVDSYHYYPHFIGSSPSHLAVKCYKTKNQCCFTI